MPVNQGLKTLIESTPNFNNQHVQNLIAPVNIGFVTKTRTLVQKTNASTVLTVSQKNDLNETLDIQPHLNLGKVLEDLDLHTAKIYTGALGEARDDNPASLFLDHVQTVQGFITTIPNLYGYTADSINKGVAGHFGTVSGSVTSAMDTLKEAVVHINSKSESTDTAFQTAAQNLINFLDSLGDSTSFDESTFNSLQSAYQTAANNFDTELQNGDYAVFRTNMINQRKIIVDQIALEVGNLGTIDTYNESLASLSIYSALAEDTDVRNLIIQSSQNNTFKSYFENYTNRESQLNPLFTGLADDSAETTAIDEILKLKGLPDVVDFLDLDSVASKAQRDDRLKTTVSFKGLSTEQIITLACETLKISIDNKDVYAKSKSLLTNLNNHDRDLVKTQIDANQQIDTLS
tara:strand:+ start:226 stop:1437 length:1212 start_codon:yes stop_codon:yes gene_type:complete